MQALRQSIPQIARGLARPVGARLYTIKSPVMFKDASESESTAVTQKEGEETPAYYVSGAPETLHERTVRIYKPTRTTMSSGKDQTRFWRIDFDVPEMAERWENQLIGWASSADPMQSLRLKFLNKEDAIQFAEKQGWNYYVQEPKSAHFKKKEYKTNFLYSPDKLRWIQTK